MRLASAPPASIAESRVIASSNGPVA